MVPLSADGFVYAPVLLMVTQCSTVRNYHSCCPSYMDDMSSPSPLLLFCNKLQVCHAGAQDTTTAILAIGCGEY